jgi:chemotaxis family two-component system response regulator Rcp1
LIEDNPADAELVHQALEAHDVDCDLQVITDGDRAVRHIHALGSGPGDCPDLVIVDLNLPKRSGREVLQMMAHCARCRDTTVVVLSSSDAPKDRGDSADLGASHYLRKPLHLEEFLSLGAIFKALLENAQHARTS